MQPSTKLNLHRNITSMSRLSLKSRTKSLLAATYEQEARRLHSRLAAAPLERWTAQKMCLPSATALAVEDSGSFLAPKTAIAIGQATHQRSIRLRSVARSSSGLQPIATAQRRQAASALLYALPSPGPSFGISSTPGPRQLSTIIDNRMVELDGRIPGDKIIDLVQIMDDLRDLELVDKLNKVTPKSATGFKDATRALYPLYHRFDSGEKTQVTFAELRHELSPIFSVPWTHIAERLLYGKNFKLASLSAQDKASIQFLRVYNVGAARAQAFVKAGARSLKDLAPLADAKKISLLRAQRVGLRHIEDIERLIPRSEMEKLREALELAVKAADPSFECEILGSYRRRADFSSDIDLAIRHKSFVNKDDLETAAPLIKKLVDELSEFNLINTEDELMYGPKKWAGFIRLPRHKHFRRIDVRLTPYHSYPYCLLGCSGDAILMKLLRHTAKERGLTLNEYGMGEKWSAADQNPNGFRPGTLRVVESEREIFEILGFPALEPHQRDYSVWRPIYEAAGVDVSYVDKL